MRNQHYVVIGVLLLRTSYNYALQRAVEWANKLSQPLIILEPPVLDYPMSSVRFHKFMMDGMKEVPKIAKVSLLLSLH